MKDPDEISRDKVDNEAGKCKAIFCPEILLVSNILEC